MFSTQSAVVCSSGRSDQLQSLLREIGFRFLIHILTGPISVRRGSFENLGGSDLAAATRACVLQSFIFERPVSLQMDEQKVEPEEKCLDWILMVSFSPIAFLLYMLMALYSLLRFLSKAALLLIIVTINTPFIVMYNVSILVFLYHLPRLACFWESVRPIRWNWPNPKFSVGIESKSSRVDWNWSDPRASVGIEVKLLVSDFFKVVATELLLVVSTGIITYFTAPKAVFYYSTAIWLVAIFHKWLNKDCLSRTALSCLCDGYGLSPTMFLFSFIGFFDIGCHPIAKCSFVADRAYVFLKDVPKHGIELHSAKRNVVEGPSEIQLELTIAEPHPIISNHSLRIAEPRRIIPSATLTIAELHRIIPNSTLIIAEPHRIISDLRPMPPMAHPKISKPRPITVPVNSELNIEQDNKKFNAMFYWCRFESDPKEFKDIEFPNWNAFERGLFQLNPRINFIKRENGKYILKSSMVLKLRKQNLCEYPVERLELPKTYEESKVNELYNFLNYLSSNNGFVTDKMRGRYEHSLTLLQIVEGVQENIGYKIVKPLDERFVVAGCTKLQ